MRFYVVWLDEEGFADHAQHFEHPEISSARRHLAQRITTKKVPDGIRGYFLAYADPAFVRRYTVAPGGPKQTRMEYCEKMLVCENFQHLLREEDRRKAG